MKTKLIALSLFTATTGFIAFYPALQSIDAIAAIQPRHNELPQINLIPHQRQQIEVVFVLDTTGSMSGMIEAAKEKIWSIASNMASAQSAPEIKIGLVAYRDRGDSYVTRVIDLSEDLDSMYAQLMDFSADGGGDRPESVNQALDDAINKISWSQNPSAYRVVFLVGDAPPHMDYQDDIKYPQSLTRAKHKGIVVNTIQCGKERRTTFKWKQIANLGDGSYFQVDQNGGAFAVTTPFDNQLAKLSEKLDKTRLYYGSEKEKIVQHKKLAATEKLHASASVESRARRATFNASKSGKDNFLGKGELIDDVASGRVELKRIDKAMLPAPMQTMAPAEQAAEITKRADERQQLQTQIKAIAEQRAAFINEKVAKSSKSKESLDYKIHRAVRDQAEKKGLKYESGALNY